MTRVIAAVWRAMPKVALYTAERWAVIVAAILFALVMADVMSGGLLTQYDQDLRDVIQPRSEGAPRWMVFPGGFGNLWVAAVVMMIAGAAVAQVAWRWWPVAFAVGTFAVAEIAIFILKTIVGRPGPGEWADRTGYPGYFPSGHTVTSAICVATVAYLLLAGTGLLSNVDYAAAISLAVGLIAGALTGARAILDDSHWVFDVVGGLLLTTVILIPSFAFCRGMLNAPKSAAHTP